MGRDVMVGEFPPGPSGLPVVGAMPKSVLGGLEFRDRMAEEYGAAHCRPGSRGHDPLVHTGHSSTGVMSTSA